MKLTGHRCKCAACGLVFSRTSVFDAHRTGSFRKPGERRCMTDAELKSHGFVMVDGVWKWPPEVKQPELQTTSPQTNTRVAGREKRGYFAGMLSGPIQSQGHSNSEVEA